MASTKEHARQSGRKSTRKSQRHPGRKTNPEEEVRRHKREAALMKERRILIVTTALTLLAFTVWIVAISTDYWTSIHVPATPGTTNGSSSRISGKSSHSGLWYTCFVVTTNETNDSLTEKTLCEVHNLDSSVEAASRGNADVARVIIDYRRTVMALAVISIFVMAMAVAFSIYTFRNPRYTFKRLAGGINILTAAIVLVLIEVVSGGAAFWWMHFGLLHPGGSSWHYGFSFFLAWLTFLFYLYAGLTFLFYSRRKKGDRAPNEDMALTDGPQIMGR